MLRYTGILVIEVMIDVHVIVCLGEESRGRELRGGRGILTCNGGFLGNGFQSTPSRAPGADILNLPVVHPKSYYSGIKELLCFDPSSAVSKEENRGIS